MPAGSVLDRDCRLAGGLYGLRGRCLVAGGGHSTTSISIAAPRQALVKSGLPPWALRFGMLRLAVTEIDIPLYQDATGAKPNMA